MKTWRELVEAAKAQERVQVVSLLKPYFCADTGGKFKRGHRFNVSDHGSLWLKESKSHKWKYEPAIKVDQIPPSLSNISLWRKNEATHR